MDKVINNVSTLRNADSVPYLSFKPLNEIPWLKHGFSTKLGGVSEGIYASMNLGMNRGDDDTRVYHNYDRICQSIGIDYRDLVFTDQVHKTNVRVAKETDKGKGILYKRDYSEIDGHITDKDKLPLLVFGADCVPLYFVDKEHKAIGLAHSGWKGTAHRMGKVMTEKMKEMYDSIPENLIAVIGPSICGDCYEVGTEVYNSFLDCFPEKEMSTFFKLADKNKYHLDLWEANRHVLLDSGLRDDNIHISGVCTMCRKDLLFSHRRDGLKRGSMAAFMSIDEQQSAAGGI